MLARERNWEVNCVSYYSQHDLGFGDYPHRSRTNLRHANAQLPFSETPSGKGVEVSGREPGALAPLAGSATLDGETAETRGSAAVLAINS